MSMERKNNIMIAWVGYQRRAEAMKDFWNYEVLYFPKVLSSRKLLPLDYLIRSIQTIATLAQRRPKQVWIQSPPSFLLYIASFYKFARGSRAVVIADLHNSFFRPKWLSFPFLRSCLGQMNAVLVHNKQVAQDYSGHFGAAANLHILEDRSVELRVETRTKVTHHDSILFPCSFDEDEPIGIVFEAALKVPEARFCITGKHEGKLPCATALLKPSNVELLGFLPIEQFDDLLASAGAVLGLTTRDNVQLSVANEAISYGKAMVLSDTPTLRELFDGARFVDTLDPNSIASGVKDVLRARLDFEKASSKGLERKIARWDCQAARLKEALHE